MSQNVQLRRASLSIRNCLMRMYEFLIHNFLPFGYHTFSLYQNVILGKFLARSLNSVGFYPRQKIHDNLLPYYLLDFVNGVQQIEMEYELQHSTVALPFHQMSPECKPYPDSMRDSLAFQLYFVMSDCLLLVAVIVVITYSTVFFFLEMLKRNAFRASATSSAHSQQQRAFWTLPRITYCLNVVLIDALLLTQICFTVYWLIVDFDGVFLIQIIRYIELFSFYSLTFYFTALSIIKIFQLNVFNE